MARKKTTVKTAKLSSTKTAAPVENAPARPSWMKQIKFGESYMSLLLGIVVVIVVAVLVIAFARDRRQAQEQPNTPEVSSDQTENTQAPQAGSTYTVQEGDSLWIISEKVYQSGYNWVDIMEANKLTSPDAIETGMKLTLPKVEPKEKTVEQDNEQTKQQSQETTEKITGDSYTVQPGDSLWDIAVRTYGDGYKWPQLAQTNNLANPDLIYPGTKLALPKA